MKWKEYVFLIVKILLFPRASIWIIVVVITSIALTRRIALDKVRLVIISSLVWVMVIVVSLWVSLLLLIIVNRRLIVRLLIVSPVVVLLIEYCLIALSVCLRFIHEKHNYPNQNQDTTNNNKRNSPSWQVESTITWVSCRLGET